MKIFSITILFWFTSLVGQAQTLEYAFEVTFKDKKIGTLHAKEEKSATRTIKDLRTETDTKIIMMSIHVESEVSVTHSNDGLIKGTAYRHANRGSEDVHAHVTRLGTNLYEIERNGKKDKLENTKITFCVIDLYFREPKGIKNIFSNMYAQMLSIKQIEPGKYQLITPDKKNSTYTYRNGKLMTIETDTPVGKVISKRQSS